MPIQLLLRRLRNEEEELRKAGYDFDVEDFISGERGKLVKVNTIYGEEYVEAIRKYTIVLRAKGYEKTPNGDIIRRDEHKVAIYILRHYPFPSSSKLGAPIRFEWITPIFHPNISQGTSAGGKGIVCWHILQDWLPTLNLLTIVKGLEQLVEKPNLADILLFPETREAAKWFEERLNKNSG